MNAVADGFDDLELLKRYSTAVMGPSQGRHSAVNTLRIAMRAAVRPTDGMRLTTQRPPFSPEPIALLAGRAFQPVRHTAMHHRHLEAGAIMMPAGLWLRPAYYGHLDERETCIASEAHAVRNKVGIIDVFHKDNLRYDQLPETDINFARGGAKILNAQTYARLVRS